MADEATPQSKVDDLDIENMKVAELKKKLKDIGLPVTGNKSELVERLQESLLAAKNNEAPNPGELESSSSELDSSLLNDSKVNSSSNEPDTKTCEEESSVSSPQKSKEPSVTTSVSIPLKKRAIAQTSAENSEKPKEKRIVLNRNHIPTPKFIPNKPAEPVKSRHIVMDGVTLWNKNKDSKEATTTASAIKDGPNKICLNPSKSMSEDERISLRAKRFNITAPEPTSKSGKIAISSKKDEISKPASTGSSDLAPEAGPTLNVLQKRALRFGENVSKVLRQLEEQQKVLKRKSKFNVGNGATSAEEQEKKKKRAERFGLS